MKKIILLISLLIGCNALAQQDAMLSQYMFNGLFINPAYAGSRPYFSTTVLYRNQWVNFKGAPETSIFSIDGPIKNEKMGIGLIVANDQIGVTNQTDVYANYSYFLPLGDAGKLSFGIKAGASQYQANLSSLNVWDSGDIVFEGNIKSFWMPKFGFGAYFHKDGKYYAGITIPQLVAYSPNQKFNFDVEKSTSLRRHFYLNGGYIFHLYEQIKLKPSFLVKYVPAAPLQADVNCSVMFIDMIWIGASYRTGDALIGIVEYQANQRFRIGYSFDMTVSKLSKYTAGSHEIMIGYDFGKDLAKVKTPRFF